MLKDIKIKRSVFVKDVSNNEMKLLVLPENIMSEIIQTGNEINTRNESLIIIKHKNEYKIEIKRTMTRRQLKTELQERYPDAVFDDGYNYDPSFKDCIWCKHDVFNEDDEPMLDYVMYQDTNGVHPELQELLNEAGWFCQWATPEIPMLYEKSKYN